MLTTAVLYCAAVISVTRRGVFIHSAHEGVENCHSYEKPKDCCIEFDECNEIFRAEKNTTGEFDTGVSFAVGKHISLPIRRRKRVGLDCTRCMTPTGIGATGFGPPDNYIPHKKNLSGWCGIRRTVAPTRFYAAASTDLFINRVPKIPLFRL
jgi:hypothetical protein